MPGEHSIKIASSYEKFAFFADSLGRRKDILVLQYNKQMTPEPVQSHRSVCIFYTINAALHLFKFRLEEDTGDHDVSVLSFICSYMERILLFNVIVQVIHCFCYHL